MSNDMTALRAHIFEQLAELRATGINNPDALKGAIAKASAVADLAKVLTDTAKVEVDYIRAAGGGESVFLDGATGKNNLPAGITSVFQHRLAG